MPTPRRTLDTTYPPGIQPDYGGKIFSHQYSRLRQLPVYDADGNLVPTDELWNHLQPGTLIILNADLVCWVYKDDKCCKVYQLQVHFVKICAESPHEATPPKIRLFPDIDGTDNDDTSSSPTSLPPGPPGPGSGGAGKGKGRAFKDSLLFDLDMSPSKKNEQTNEYQLACTVR